MDLKPLRNWYNRYEDFWKEWKTYKHNGLTERQITSIEVWQRANFYIDTAQLKLFHNKTNMEEKLVKPLVEALSDSYQDYKGWVADKFLHYLVQSSMIYGEEGFLDLPIDQLRINDSEKENLKKFNCVNVGSIISSYEGRVFLTDEIFSLILLFRDPILKRRLEFEELTQLNIHYATA